MCWQSVERAFKQARQGAAPIGRVNGVQTDHLTLRQTEIRGHVLRTPDSRLILPGHADDERHRDARGDELQDVAGGQEVA